MLKTITTDNGSGFSEHEWITKNLGVSVYFTDNYYSMQKVQVIINQPFSALKGAIAHLINR